MLSVFALLLAGPVVAPQARPGARVPKEPVQSPAGLINPERLLIQLQPDASVAAVARAHARAGGHVLQDLKQIGWQVVEVDARTLQESREAYLREPSILRADFDHAKRLAYVPNDPYWPMWHMQKIRADVAWNTHKGSP